MTMGPQNRGAVRASCFDVTIAARRLENVSTASQDMAPETREKIAGLATELRAFSLKLRGALTPEEQRDLSRVFD